MSKSTIVDGRDNQEVTGVTAEGRGEQGNSCLQRLHYAVLLAIA